MSEHSDRALRQRVLPDRPASLNAWIGTFMKGAQIPRPTPEPIEVQQTDQVVQPARRTKKPG